MKNSCSVQHPVCLALLMFIAHTTSVQAGDTRHVSEPLPPQICTVLQADNLVDSTTSIQVALEHCAKGKAVSLVASKGNNVFYSGPLSLPSGVSLLIDARVTLKAIANPSLFDAGKNSCGTLDDSGNGCQPFILIKNASGSGIYGRGTIDGQGDTPMAGKSQSWWQLAADAKKRNMKQNAPRLIQIDHSENITLYQIILKNSPNFHVVSNNTDGVTLWGITIDTPATARNTDGFDPMGSKNVTLAYSNISTGDDNVAVKAGHQESSHISILDNRFGAGHGMSIGSEVNKGVSDVTVKGLILDGTTNGLRIKSDRSRGGLVTGVTYDNVCMQNVKNPISLNTRYDSNARGQQIPEFQNIVFRNVRVLTAGDFIFEGYNEANPLLVSLQDVHVKKGSVWTNQNVILQGKAAMDAVGSCD